MMRIIAGEPITIDLDAREVTRDGLSLPLTRTELDILAALADGPRTVPEIAAARCSDSQDFAVPGTPSSSNARSVASVATAVSTRRRLPTYLGLISVPSSRVPPSTYVTTAHGDSFQLGGFGRSSTRTSAAS